MPKAAYRFEAIGTSWQIDIEDDITREQETELLEAIKKRIAVYDAHYSRFRSDSLVANMSQKAGEYTLPEDGKELFDIYKKMYASTGGAVTPLIGQALVDAGYDAQYSLETKPMQKTPAWDEIIEYDFPKLILKKPALLDVGAAGKGHLIDIVSQLLQGRGVTSFCVDAGGDIHYQNAANHTLRVGLEHPGDSAQVIGVATILNQSICGSAGNRRAWGEFHHIINPHSLTSPKHILAVWAVAKTTILADALTTALFFTPAQQLKNEYEFEYVIVREDFSVEKSPNFSGELFLV